MTATDELRRMLDEHGVEHYDGTESTLWLKDEHGYRASADELTSGRLSIHIWCDTPAQAIAATLGDTDAMATRQGDADERNSKLFETARKWMAKAAHFEAENAKLREFASEAFSMAFNFYHGAGTAEDLRELEAEYHELGIEVNE